MEITSYRDLKVWQSAIDLAAKVYALSGDFPKSEFYGLTAQMRRALARPRHSFAWLRAQ